MIQITKQEAEAIVCFIRQALSREWDSYTDRYICSVPEEVGMRRMDPDMYDWAERLQLIIDGVNSSEEGNQDA